MRSLRLALPLFLVCLTREAVAEDRAAVEQFEQKIRPLLVEKCLECHGTKKQQGNLRLDTRAALLKGNESGAAVVVGQPGESRLLQVLAYKTDDIQMPPAGKLSDAEIAAVTQWIQQGAVWPENSAPMTADTNAPDPAKHWSFQPMQSTTPPAVKAVAQVRNAIDAFLLSSLEQAGLSYSDPAPRATWLRRATFDLWGLPPAYADVVSFENDSSPDAEAQVIERLLASPRYGERWARYWLDIARYADTKGYVFTEEPRYPYAYTYRDYVIDAFNEDKPYNRFIREQLAADQLDLGDDTRDLAALGFLTVGRRFLNNTHDIIDDRIDVVTRGLLGLTVGCARCHDHKYDPIPTADYYSLYGVFASTNEPKDLPIIGPSHRRADYEKFAAELGKRQAELQQYEVAAAEKIAGDARQKVGEYLALIAQPQGESPGKAARALVTGEPRPAIVKRWRDFLAQRAKQPDPIFGPWHKWMGKSGDDFTQAVSAWQAEPAVTEGPDRVHPRVRQTLAAGSIQSPVELANVYGELLAAVNQQWLTLKEKQPEATALPDAADEELRQVLYAAGTPPSVTAEEAKALYQRDERNKQRDLAKKIENLQATSPGAPPRAMIVADNAKPFDPRIFIRGNSGRPGDHVPRRFLAAVSGPERKPFAHGSGRLDLADAIVNPQNPLTARVIVNRVWQHHFGQGLVRSEGDFGLRGEQPTHPALLDHLALRFMEAGWSLKWLQREIMTSAAYRQASVDRPAARAIDPENRLLWKMPRQRLELEALRDSWLAAADRLDESLGGRPYDSITDPKTGRRTIYGLVNRNDLPNVFRAFDFANPDASDPERPQTSVPQQTLFAMNSPFVLDQARRAAATTATIAEPAARVEALTQQILSRRATPAEIEMATAYVQQAGTAPGLNPWERLAQILMLTNEFLFVD